MILDASPIIAYYRSEATALAIERLLTETSPLAMSVVNLVEVMIVLQRDAPAVAPRVPAELAAFDVELVSPDLATALLAAEARGRFSINFGDTFCYALAKIRGEPILTLDADFTRTDAALVPPTPPAG